MKEQLKEQVPELLSPFLAQPTHTLPRTRLHHGEGYGVGHVRKQPVPVRSSPMLEVSCAASRQVGLWLCLLGGRLGASL